MSKITAFFEKKLEKRLSKLKIEELITEMCNDNYYFPYNIWKKCFDNQSIIGGKQISWFAVRQADKLNDKADFVKIKHLIETERPNDDWIRSAYTCIGRLSRNTEDKAMYDYLLDKLESETDEFTKTSILIEIKQIKKSDDYNLKPIINILQKGTIILKTEAAMALNNSSNPDVEIALLESLQKEKNKHLHSMIASTLRDIGTEKSLPVLENLMKNAKGTDYKYFIGSAIESIKDKMKL